MKPKYELKHGLVGMHTHINDYYNIYLADHATDYREACMAWVIYIAASHLNNKLAIKLVKQIKAAGFDTSDWD